MCSSVFKHGLMQSYIHSSFIIDEGIFPNARGKGQLQGLVHRSVGIEEGGWKE